MVSKHPRYPFPFEGLAVCLKDQGDGEWLAYAKWEIRILQKTVNLPGAHRGHRFALERLRGLIGVKNGG